MERKYFTQIHEVRIRVQTQFCQTAVLPSLVSPWWDWLESGSWGNRNRPA